MKSRIVGLICLLTGISFQIFGQKELSDHYWQKAEKLAIEGKNEQSLKFYEKAFDLIKNTDPFRAANLCNDMSSAHFANGHYDVSIRYCYQGLSFLKKQTAAPDSLYFKLYTSLGTMHNALEHMDSSHYYFQAADDVLFKNPVVEKQIPNYVLHHYLHQGRVVWLLHRYQQSIAYFTKAKAISENYRLADEKDFIESSLAEVYDMLKEHRTALKYRLAALTHQASDLNRIQLLYSGIGYTYEKLNMIDSALFWQKVSWKTHLEQPKHTAQYKKQHVELLFLIGSLYRRKGLADKASAYLNLASQYQTGESTKNILIEALILIEKGNLARSHQELSQAEWYFHQAFTLICLPSSGSNISSIDMIYPQVGLQALLLHATMLFERYKLSKNPTHLEAAYHSFLNLIKLKRSVYIAAAEDTEERHFMSFESFDVFKEAIPAGYSFYQTNRSPVVLEEVFSWFEEANATYLYDIIKDKQIQVQKLSPDILAKEQRLLQTRAFLARSENSSSDSVKRELENLRIQWYKLRTDIRKQYPLANHPENKSIHFSQVQQQLDKESAFISYKWFNGRVYAFVITSDTTHLMSWPVNEDLLKSYLFNIQAQFSKNPGFGNYKGTLSAIGCYKMLFEPIKKWVAPRKRLVIARDWQFNFLPFELLENGAKTGNYLAKEFAISYTYSASFFWQHPFGGASKAKKSLTIAPFVKEQILPDTNWTAISSLADILEIGGEHLWGRQATKQQLLKSGLDYSILHFATHAHSADDNPNDSFIQLFPGIDSRLYLNEIYTLPLHSTRLVILSACSAGSGKNLRGEGNISLAHAIAQAGCPSVIATSWEANDVVANYLSLRLHQYLNQGFALDRALQRARLDFFENEDFKRYGHPYYWANLTLIGNNKPVYKNTSLPAYSYFTISVLFIFLVAVLIIYSKKQRPHQ